MRKIINYFDNLSIKNKLIILFLFVALVPSLTIGLISFRISFDAVKDRRINETTNKLETIDERVDNFLNEKSLVTIKFALDDNLQSILMHGSEINSDDYTKKVFNLKKMLYDYKFSEDTYSIYILGNNSDTYTNDYNSGDVLEDLYSLPWYREGITRNKSYFFGEIMQFGEFRVLPLVRIIKEKQDAKPIGSIVLNIEEKAIYNIYKDEIQDAADHIIIFNEKNDVISSDDKSLLNKNIQDIYKSGQVFSGTSGYFEAEIYNSDYIFIYNVDRTTEWKYVGIIPVSKIVASTDSIKNTTISIFILCILFCSLFSIFLSKRVSKPLEKLIRIMDRAESGNLDPDMNPKYNDEIGRLATSYNNMVIRLKKSIDEIYEIQNMKREAEYKALMFQINPHFLYNTLSSIIWLTNKGDKEKVIDMVTALSSLFRLSISKGKELITISEELEHVKSYLRIQNIRYQGQFRCVYDVDLDILNYYTIKIILQPLVENAIYHGIRDNDINGVIKINGWKEEGKIILEVIDNGNGMTYEEIDFMNSFLENGRNENNFGIGVKNVNDRIGFYFKERYGLRFEKRDVLTIARVTLPIIKEVKDDCIIY